MCQALSYVLRYDSENGRHDPCAQGAYCLVLRGRQYTAVNEIIFQVVVSAMEKQNRTNVIVTDRMGWMVREGLPDNVTFELRLNDKKESFIGRLQKKYSRQKE